MSFIRTQDILKTARGFHRKLAEYYADRALEVEDPRAKLLLEYMAGHELELERGLVRYEKGATKKILESWFQYATDRKQSDFLGRLTLGPTTDATDVIEAALEMNSLLKSWYDEVIHMAPNADVKQMLESLVSMQDRNEQRTVWSTLMGGRLPERDALPEKKS